ncbi:MAG: hypothetical protein MUF30_05850 [Burkholderiales bacterium]|jgi:hypothetical protein|nr:hypothetical protein [Burkholderiales bacterium]
MAPRTVRVMCIVWPAFLMAGVLEILVFAMVDPGELHGVHGAPSSGSPIAVYSAAFLAFWAVVTCAAALAVWLHQGLDADAAADAREARA